MFGDIFEKGIELLLSEMLLLKQAGVNLNSISKLS